MSVIEPFYKQRPSQRCHCNPESVYGISFIHSQNRMHSLSFPPSSLSVQSHTTPTHTHAHTRTHSPGSNPGCAFLRLFINFFISKRQSEQNSIRASGLKVKHSDLKKGKEARSPLLKGTLDIGMDHYIKKCTVHI